MYGFINKVYITGQQRHIAVAAELDCSKSYLDLFFNHCSDAESVLHVEVNHGHGRVIARASDTSVSAVDTLFSTLDTLDTSAATMDASSSSVSLVGLTQHTAAPSACTSSQPAVGVSIGAEHRKRTFPKIPKKLRHTSVIEVKGHDDLVAEWLTSEIEKNKALTDKLYLEKEKLAMDIAKDNALKDLKKEKLLLEITLLKEQCCKLDGTRNNSYR